MYKQLAEDLADQNRILSLTKERAMAYLDQINEGAVSVSASKPGSFAGLPEDGVGAIQALITFHEQHRDKIVASSGPRYWGYVVGGTTPAAIAGDWLTSAFDQNPQGTNGGGDISAMIEQQAIKWLLELFGLPQTFKGGFVTGATMSNFTCLAVARQWAGKTNNNDIAREGIKTEIKILTATPHSSAIKSLSMLGLGSNNIITVNTAEGNREAMDITDLEQKIRVNSDFPIIIISSGGTVNTVDFDDMQGIAQLQKKYGFYWHIDAAFGAFAACSENTAHLINGWQYADSITIDCHKWLNVPYDSAIYLVKETHANLQIQTFQNSNAPYLGDPLAEFNYLNAGPENSRRLRALPAWFSLLAYGKNGYKWIVENNIRLANEFASELERKTDFILASPVRLNVVCFTLADQATAKEILTGTFMRLNESGKVFMTLTKYKEMFCLRAAFVNWRTDTDDIQIAINELVKASVKVN